MNTTIMRAGLDGSGYVDGARVITKANLDIETSVGRTHSAIQSLEGRFGGIKGSATSHLGAAKQAIDNLHTPLQNIQRIVEQVESRIIRIGATVAVFRLIGGAISSVTSFIRESIDAVDDFRVATIQIAAGLTQVAILNKESNLAKAYQESSAYAEVLALKMQEVDKHSLANYKGLMAMLQVMTAQGVVLDVNNKKQVDAFTSISNAVALYTAGQDQQRQMYQETRALLSGQITQGSQVARILDLQIKQQGIYKNGLRDVIALGRQHGDTLERLAPYLVGINMASADISKTWTALKTSFQTTMNIIQRATFGPIVADIINIVEGVSDSLRKNAPLVAKEFQTVWLMVKEILFVVDQTSNRISIKPEILSNIKQVASLMKDVGLVFVKFGLELIEHSNRILFLLGVYATYRAARAADTVLTYAGSTALSFYNSVMGTGTEILIGRAKMMAVLGVTEKEVLNDQQRAIIATQQRIATEASGITSSLAAAEAVQAKSEAINRQSSSVIAAQGINTEFAALTKQMTLVELERTQQLINSLRVRYEESVALSVVMEQEVAALKIKQSSIAAELEYAKSKLQSKQILLAENIEKQKQIALEIESTEAAVANATRRQSLALENLTLQKQLTESQLVGVQAEIAKYEGTDSRYIQLIGWKKQEAALNLQLEEMTAKQIVMEENLAVAKNKASTRLGLVDNQAAQIALQEEQLRIQKQIQNLTENSNGLNRKEYLARVAVTEAEQALNAARGNSAQLSRSLYAAEEQLLNVQLRLGENEAKLAFAQNSLLQAKIRAIEVDNAAVLAADKYNAALLALGQSTGFVSATQLRKVQTDFLSMNSEKQVLAVTVAHEEALLIQKARLEAAAAANATYSISANLAATATSVLNRALSLLGGPIGLITFAIMGGVWAWQKWGSAAKEAHQDAIDSADKVIEKLNIQLEKLRAIKRYTDNKDLGKPTETEDRAKALLSDADYEVYQSLNKQIENYDRILSKLPKTGVSVVKETFNGVTSEVTKQVNDVLTTAGNVSMMKQRVINRQMEMIRLAEAVKEESPKAPKSNQMPDDSVVRMKATDKDKKEILNSYLNFMSSYWKNEISLQKSGASLLQVEIDNSYKNAEISQLEHLKRTHENQSSMLNNDLGLEQKHLDQLLKAYNDYSDKYKKIVATDEGLVRDPKEYESQLLKPPVRVQGQKQTQQTVDEENAYNRQQTEVKELLKLLTDINDARVKIGNTQKSIGQEDLKYLQNVKEVNWAITKQYEDQGIEFLKNHGYELEAFQLSKQTAEYKRTVIDVDNARLKTAQDALKIAKEDYDLVKEYGDLYSAPAKKELELSEKNVKIAEKIISNRNHQNALDENAIRLKKELEKLDIAAIARETSQLKSSFAASQIGADKKTGIVTDDYANLIAIEKDRHTTAMQNLEDEFNRQQLNYGLTAQNSEAERLAREKVLKVEELITQERIKGTQNIGKINYQEQVKAYEALAVTAQKVFPKITAFQTAAHLITKKYATEEKQSGETQQEADLRIYRAKSQMISDYAGFGAEMFANLADSQDQSSKKGFESAKNLNVAAAVMSTAAAVIAQLAGPDGWSPSAWARSIAAGLLGALQVAKIMSTSYGGGGNVGVGGVSAGFGSSYSSTTVSGTGSSIGSPTTSIQNSQTEQSLQHLAYSAENASIALGKVADGLTKISDLFSSGTEGSTLGQGLTVPAGIEKGGAGWMSRLWNGPYQWTTNDMSTNWNRYQLVNNDMSDKWNLFRDFMNGKEFSGDFYKQLFITSIVNPTKDMWNTMISTTFGPAVSLWNSMFGGEKWVSGQGINLGLVSGKFSGRSFAQITESGGWFGSDSTSNMYDIMDKKIESALNSMVTTIESQINRSSVVLGTTIDYSKINLPGTDIPTSGRTAEDIQKDIEKWFNQVADIVAQNVVGLKEFTNVGESAFDAIIRLTTSLQGVNEKLYLINGTLIESSLVGANTAYKMTQLFGGLDKYVSSLDDYVKSMYSEDEQKALKAIAAQQQVKTVFSEMNSAYINDAVMTIPKTKAEFIAFVNEVTAALNDNTTMYTTASGELVTASDRAQALFKTLMDLSPAFGELQDYLDSLAQAAIDNSNKLKDAILESQKYQTERADQAITDLQKSVDLLKQSILAAIDARIALIQTYENLRTDNNLTILNPQQQYDELLKQVQTTYAKANSGDNNAMVSFNDIAQKFISYSRQMFASGINYGNDYNMIMDMLTTLTNLSKGSTLSDAQQQILALQSIKDAINSDKPDSLKVALNTVNSSLVQGPDSLLQGIKDLIHAMLTLSDQQKANDLLKLESDYNQAIKDRDIAKQDYKKTLDAYTPIKAQYDKAQQGVTEAKNISQYEASISYFAEKRKNYDDYQSAMTTFNQQLADATISEIDRKNIQMRQTEVSKYYAGIFANYGSDFMSQMVHDTELRQLFQTTYGYAYSEAQAKLDALANQLAPLADNLSTAGVTLNTAILKAADAFDKWQTSLTGVNPHTVNEIPNIPELSSISAILTDYNKYSTALKEQIKAINAYNDATNIDTTISLFGANNTDPSIVTLFNSLKDSFKTNYGYDYDLTKATQNLNTAYENVGNLQSVLARLSDALGNISQLINNLSDNPINNNSSNVVSLAAYKQSIPGFASGISKVPYDMTANIHKDEIVMDSQASNALRQYGIRVHSDNYYSVPISQNNRDFVGENIKTTDELQRTNDKLEKSNVELVKQTRELQLMVKALQYGFEKLIVSNERQAEASEEMADIASREASAGRR